MKSMKPKKSTAIMLEMAKHPIPRKMFTVLGRKCLFAYPLSHLSLLSLIFGYTNIITVYRFSIYSSLITGNSVNFALYLYKGEYLNAYFTMAVVFSHVVFGVSIDCYLLNTLKSRENAYAVISILLGLACILVDSFSLSGQESRYIVLVLSTILGALAHWTCKLGYVTMCLRGNLLNWMESTYKYVAGYSQGGPKSKGDSFIVTTIITSFFIGIILALIALQFIRDFSLLPITFTIPLQLKLAGCFGVWRSNRTFSKIFCCEKSSLINKEEIKNQTHAKTQTTQVELKSITELQNIKNILGENVADNDIDTEDPNRLSRVSDILSINSGRHSFSLRNSLALPILSTLINDMSTEKDTGFSIFSSVEMSLKELEEYEDLINSFGHKNELLQTV